MAAPGVVRKLIKRHADIRRGASCPEVERHITTAALSLWRSLSEQQQQRLLDGEADVVEADVVLQHYHEPVVPSRGRQPMIAAASPLRHWSALAHDRFLAAKRKEVADSIPMGMRTERRIRELCYLRFSPLSIEDKKGWLPDGYEIRPRVRRMPAAGVEVEEEVAAPATPVAGESAAPPEPESTEKRGRYQSVKQKSFESLGRHLVDVVEAHTSSEASSSSGLGTSARHIFAQCWCKMEDAQKRQITGRLRKSKYWSPKPRAYAGRVKGSHKISDEALTDIIKPYTAESSRWCKTKDQVV